MACPGCGKPRPPGGSGLCPDCVLKRRREREDVERLSRIERSSPPALAKTDDDFEVVWNGKGSLSDLSRAK